MRLILCWLLLFYGYGCFGQRQPREPDYTSAITFSPLALLQIDYTLMGGIEFRLQERLMLLTEGGYIYASSYIGNSAGASGFIIRPSVKFFPARRKNFYLQSQFFYKNVTHKLHDWLGKLAVNGVPTYEELQDFRFRREVYGGNFIAGFLLPISKGNAFIDLYAGFGIRFKSEHLVKEPTSVYNAKGLVPVSATPFPSLPGGIRFIIPLHHAQ
jgi:hypothetical protein